jgi:hypothetical protein
MTEKKKQYLSSFDPEKLDLSSFSANELVKVITGIEAPTIKQKFEALEVLAEKAPQGDGTLNLITDIISELQKPDDYSSDSKDVAEGKESAKQGALGPLEILMKNPDGFGPEGIIAVIELAAGFYRMVDHFSVLSSQTADAKSNPF